ncbi:MAG: pentapeptide repeat-containing protein, partial [Bacteroidota bacterium]
DYSSLAGLPLSNTSFKDCSLKEADFTEAKLDGADFSGSNLDRALFEYTDLKKVDFRTARSFRIDPEVNQLKGAKFGYDGLMGLLGKYGIEVE